VPFPDIGSWPWHLQDVFIYADCQLHLPSKEHFGLQVLTYTLFVRPPSPAPLPDVTLCAVELRQSWELDMGFDPGVFGQFNPSCHVLSHTFKVWYFVCSTLVSAG
jgi:hypothetical protein